MSNAERTRPLKLATRPLPAEPPTSAGTSGPPHKRAPKCQSGSPAAGTKRSYTLEDVKAFPAVIPAQVADRVLGMGTTLGKALRRTGRYPVRVLTYGRFHKVSVADLLAYLEGTRPCPQLEVVGDLSRSAGPGG